MKLFAKCHTINIDDVKNQSKQKEKKRKKDRKKIRKRSEKNTFLANLNTNTLEKIWQKTSLFKII